MHLQKRGLRQTGEDQLASPSGSCSRRHETPFIVLVHCDSELMKLVCHLSACVHWLSHCQDRSVRKRGRRLAAIAGFPHYSSTYFNAFLTYLVSPAYPLSSIPSLALR